MTTTLKRTNQAGFTLVELAIVLMIIGLLIGGILRGQELMENARVTTTIQQTKAYDGAATAFRDAYSALPGDMLAPGTRLPNCPAAPCSTPGDGNGLLGLAAGGVVVTRGGNDNSLPASEQRNFWLHMAVSRLISGVDASGSAVVSWGVMYPAAKIAGGFHAASMNVPAAGVITPAFSGLFLVLRNAPAGGAILEGDGLSAISPIRAAQFDRKLDDGLPNTGDVIGVGTTGCQAAAAGGGYTETIEQRNCNLLIRVQS